MLTVVVRGTIFHPDCGSQALSDSLSLLMSIIILGPSSIADISFPTVCLSSFLSLFTEYFSLTI